ncbi:DUF4232 domain-containing protein [Cognatishimia sp. MH4019]|uniref:DUF4232 domain-containing protein n=1 Tax=Cognatishimia sp. MH4019 TaxID=2854030 RepID=UPI001CD5C422|nr:DUF4232 domain-containing protein [Cognatishimia sp. MH4019]
MPLKYPLTAAALSASLATTAAADYMLTLQDTGMRSYYCTITVSLTNTTDTPLTEVNGHFFSFLGEEQVGRSKGASFLNIAPGDSAEAVFETPNAPCDEVTSYRFIIGACRIDSSFINKADCATLIDATEPISGSEGF